MRRFEYRKGVYQGKIIILFIKINGRDSGGSVEPDKSAKRLGVFSPI
jgi:hypothetical protein